LTSFVEVLEEPLKAVHDVAFPDRDDLPTGRFQSSVVLPVAALIALKLCVPKRGIRGWSPAARTIMAMPEAAVDEDNSVVGSQNDVRCAREVLAMKPIPKAIREELAPYSALGSSVATANCGHHSRAHASLNSIRHRAVRSATLEMFL
jgi:hypothetical protein